MIGGVLNTEDLVAEADKLVYLLGECGTSAQTQIETLIRQASDIMADGTQDPTKVCNGISVGFGFDMKPAQIGSVGPAAPPVVTCNPDGGAGGAAPPPPPHSPAPRVSQGALVGPRGGLAYGL
jgi:hypothetical protein